MPSVTTTKTRLVIASKSAHFPHIFVMTFRLTGPMVIFTDGFESNDTNGAYFWGNGKVPFVDPFDVPFPDPITGVFERMPRP